MQITPPDDDVLWAHALVKVHQGTSALRGASLGVHAGEVLAVTGPHGCGKSTLLQCLGGVVPADDGELWVRGTPVHRLTRAARERLRRECFGYVGPTPALLPELTAWENAALPLLLAGASRKEAYTAATEWLERLDVADCARKRPPALRQEERQRVSVARALTHRPAVVLADEPTAPLHREAADQVLRILATAARSHGISLVLASTDPAVARYADRVAEMSDGVLSEPVAARSLAVDVWSGGEWAAAEPSSNGEPESAVEAALAEGTPAGPPPREARRAPGAGARGQTREQRPQSARATPAEAASAAAPPPAPAPGAAAARGGTAPTAQPPRRDARAASRGGPTGAPP